MDAVSRTNGNESPAQAKARRHAESKAEAARARIAETFSDLREYRPDGGSASESWNDIAYRARGYGDIGKIDGSAVSKAFTGERPYTGTLVAALGCALGYKPEDVPHYRLAEARRLLDEREIGLDAALANLELSGLDVSSDEKRAAALEATETAEAAAPPPGGKPKRTGETPRRRDAGDSRP